MSMIDEMLAVGRIKAFAGNLFEVRMFGRDIEPEAADATELGQAKLFCSGFQLGSPSFEMADRHSNTKEFFIKGVKLVDEVTITWQEDMFLSTWNYHRMWFSHFYNREKDVFISGNKGKKRSATIVIQEMHNRNWPEAPDYTEDENTFHYIDLIGIMPKSFPELALGWDQDSSSASVGKSITYTVDRIHYRTTFTTEAEAVHNIAPFASPQTDGSTKTLMDREGFEI